MPHPGDTPSDLAGRIRKAIEGRIRRGLRRWPGRSIDGLSAEDLLQEVSYQLLNRDIINKFDPARATFDAFIGMCADQIMSELQRKTLNRLRLVPPPADLDRVPDPVSTAASPEEQVLGRDLERRLRDHLQSRLSVEEWLIFQRIYDDEASKEEVMTLMGIDTARYYRFRHKVKAMAKAFVEDDR